LTDRIPITNLESYQKFKSSLISKTWYQQYCDGDREHRETIRISTMDNPGWYVFIDLEWTDSENKPFQTIENDINEDNRYQCFI